MHIFCAECVEDNLKDRKRKCPQCLTKFADTDVKTVFLCDKWPGGGAWPGTWWCFVVLGVVGGGVRTEPGGFGTDTVFGHFTINAGCSSPQPSALANLCRVREPRDPQHPGHDKASEGRSQGRGRGGVSSGVRVRGGRGWVGG